MTAQPDRRRRALVCAPLGRDASIAVAILCEAGIAAESCPDIASLLAAFDQGVGAAIVTEEALADVDPAPLDAWLRAQPVWSDVPFVVLAHRGGSAERNAVGHRLMQRVGNISFIERPFRALTLASAAQAALRARDRQYLACDQQERLAQSQNRYRTLIETLPQLVWTCRPDGTCDYLSKQWIDFTGVAAEMQLDFGWLDVVVHPVDRARVFDHWQDAVAGRRPYDIDYRIRGRDGGYRWFKARATPIRDASGSILSWFGTCTDIDEVVAAREVLARSREQLEALVIERTEALRRVMAEREQAEAALRQAQKMEAVGQLTGGIAHDFNNLLQVISGGLEILDRAGDPARRERLMGGMRQAVDRGAQLTRQMLAFSRNQALRPETVMLPDLVERMRELLTRSLRGDIAIETRFEPGLWPIEVDPTQLELAIINVAVNARDAMPDGGTLLVRGSNVAAAGASEGDVVRLDMTDDGTGMTPDVQARVFEPFFTTKELGKGTGLGLPQVYGFVRQSGGHVQVESKPGRGTTVSLLFPRAEPGRLPAAQPALRTPIEVAAPAADGGMATVLLVEDDDGVAALAGDMLIQLGYRATRVSSAAAALGLLDAGERVDAVFTDVMMPGGMSGAELAREVRRRLPHMPVIITSGFDGQAVEAAEASDLPLLRKPFHLGTLGDTLRRQLARGPG